jgi:hypothetical protein
MEDKTIHLKIGKVMMEKIEKMNKYYSTNTPATIRLTINEYFAKQFKKDYFNGYQKGL